MSFPVAALLVRSFAPPVSYGDDDGGDAHPHCELVRAFTERIVVLGGVGVAYVLYRYVARTSGCDSRDSRVAAVDLAKSVTQQFLGCVAVLGLALSFRGYDPLAWYVACNLVETVLSYAFTALSQHLYAKYALRVAGDPPFERVALLPDRLGDYSDAVGTFSWSVARAQWVQNLLFVAVPGRVCTTVLIWTTVQVPNNPVELLARFFYHAADPWGASCAVRVLEDLYVVPCVVDALQVMGLDRILMHEDGKRTAVHDAAAVSGKLKRPLLS